MLKQECIRPSCPATVQEAQRRVERFVEHYNSVRLHSAIDYVTPADKLAGSAQAIVQQRDRKLAEARRRRAEARQAQVV